MLLFSRIGMSDLVYELCLMLMWKVQPYVHVQLTMASSKAGLMQY